jgi:hypothetical protein
VTDTRDTTSSSRGLLVGLVVGVPIIVYGIRGALVDASLTMPRELAFWVVGLAIVDDFLVIPAAILVGWLGRRIVPPTFWPPVRAALLCSAVLAAVAWPFIKGFGRDATNPSLLPRNYATGLAAALVVVWVAAGLWIVLRYWTGRRATSSPASSG